MLTLRIASRNILRYRGRSTVIVALIAFCTALFVIGNAVLESANKGIRESFVQSFSGDLSISAKTEGTYSLFGNEVPLVGDYESTPALARHDELKSLAASMPEASSVVSVVSGAAQLNVFERRTPAVFFGIEGDAYFKAFPSIRLVEGSFLRDGQSGAMLNQAQVNDIESWAKTRPRIGDKALLAVTNGTGFMLRELPIVGIFAYAASNESLDRICLIDATTARSLAGYSQTVVADAPSPLASGSVDDLFSGDGSGIVQSSGSIDLSKVESDLSNAGESQRTAASDGGAWNFILLRSRSQAELPRLQARLKAAIAKDGYEARLLDWRGTAGTQAQLVSAIKLVFNAGIVILAIAAIIIILNSLVISTLERSGEIGTMRAMGASRLFVSKLFVAETTMLTVGGAALGVLLGAFACALVRRAGIVVANPILETLFGGSTLHPSLGLGQALAYFATAAAVGAVAWIVPVRMILAYTPLQAMSKAD